MWNIFPNLLTYYLLLSLTIAIFGIDNEVAEWFVNPSIKIDSRTSVPSRDLPLTDTTSLSHISEDVGLKLNKIGRVSLQQTFSCSASWYLAKLDPTPDDINLLFTA